MKKRDDSGRLLYTQCDWCPARVEPGGDIEGWRAGGRIEDNPVEHHACPEHAENLLPDGSTP